MMQFRIENGNHMIVDANGVHIPSVANTPNPTTQQLTVIPSAVNKKGVVVKGLPNQTANLQEWQNSGDAVLMAVTPAGNVGIGIADPSGALHVVGTGIFSAITSPNLRVNASGSNPNGVFFSVGPNVISDSNLPVQFSSSTAINYIGLNNQAGSYGGLVGYTESEFGGGLVLRTVTATDIHFITNNTIERMTIKNSNGHIGVGTAAPVSKLSVLSGDIEAETIGNGVILKSPNGTRFRVTIGNDGALTTTQI
jgi:hypothetical protein